ncbi:uncharacterized protein LOC142590434 isoform X1 [Dermacentor variabilis]|uniref:uncharacterized protein LOC142590434 isoform X1 n=1 Tax=Dermacentor variabilis TaxID=34621 RepID=UPI003F5C512D
MSLAESITAKMACHAPAKIGGQVEVAMQCSLSLADKSVGCSLKPGSESRSVQTMEAVEQLSSTSGLTNAMSLAESITAKMACHAPSKIGGQVEVGMQCSLSLADKSVGCSLKPGSESRSMQTMEAVEQLSSTSGLTDAMSLAESITAKMACHAPSKIGGQVEVGMQCSLSLADKSVGCSLKPGSESRSMQTMEAVEQLSSTSGLTNAMSLAESITAKMACHAPSKIGGQVEVGMQCSLSIADKSVGCSLKPGSESRSVQTMEAVEQLSSTSASKQRCTHLACQFGATISALGPSISASTAKFDYSKQGCLHRCQLCDYVADELFLLEAHASIHTGEKPFYCPSSSRSFSRKPHLKAHLRTHTGEKPFDCPSCSRSFSEKGTLKAHLRTHTGEKPFDCPSCSRRFSEKGHMKAHLRTHTGEKPFDCPSCTRSFSWKSCLKVHLCTHTGEKPYQCPSCSQSFSQKSRLKVHLRTHTGEKPYQCPSCTQSFSGQPQLKAHLRTHTGEKPFDCPSCSRSFSEKGSLKAHLRTHTGEKPYQCPSCTRSFSRKPHLKAHLRTHTGEKPFDCPSCTRSFSRQPQLKAHLRTHTGEKPYQCPSCTRSFSQTAHLKAHLRTHTGEKPFDCPSCTRSFSRNGSLIVHLRTHTGEKPFDCPSCTRSFSQKARLKTHLRTHTGEKP